MAAYLARYPVVTFGSRGCHFAFLACISSSETLISSFSSGMLMLMISPSAANADKLTGKKPADIRYMGTALGTITGLDGKQTTVRIIVVTAEPK